MKAQRNNLAKTALGTFVLLSQLALWATPCVITNGAQIFAFQSSVRGTNSFITLSWASCPDHGRLVLDHEARGPSAVYYCERGQKIGYQPFDTESAACRFFFGAMKQVVTNARRVAGEAGLPAPTGSNPELEASALRRKM